MTYAQFLAIFLVMPIVVLAAVLRRRLLDRRFLGFSALLLGIALAYMAPWDHTAAIWRLWTWAEGRTWGVRLWDVPPEEYLFSLLETLLALMLLWAVMTRRGPAATNRTFDADEPEISQ